MKSRTQASTENEVLSVDFADFKLEVGDPGILLCIAQLDRNIADIDSDKGMVHDVALMRHPVIPRK